MTTASRSSTQDTAIDGNLKTNASPDDLARLMSDVANYEEILEALDSVNGDGSANSKNRLLAQLSDPEKALASRLAKLTVTGTTWASDESEVNSESDRDFEADSAYASIPETPATDVAEDTAESSLPPEEIVRLIIEEFGPLARGVEQEKLVLELDAALFCDILIAGVMHLTTHRLTFHATVLATHPELSPEKQILRSGPVVIHDNGWHKKRRVWLELSHDLLSTYSTSDETEHLKPLRTILLSKIVRIMPLDTAHPRVLRVQFSAEESKRQNGYAEFDTEESAAEWRRELTGALFVYRHLRKETLKNPYSNSGVTISIPLERISSCDIEDCLGFAKFIKLEVPFLSSDIQPRSVPSDDSRITFTMFERESDWKTLRDALKTARPPIPEFQNPVVFDFGLLSFASSDNEAVSNADSTNEIAIRQALSLGDHGIWTSRARVHRGFTCNGYFVISEDHVVGFWSKSYAKDDVVYRIFAKLIKSARPTSTRFSRHSGLKIEIEAHADLAFDFISASLRDEAVIRINDAAQRARTSLASLSITPVSSPSSYTDREKTVDPKELKIELQSHVRRQSAQLLSPISRIASLIGRSTIPVELRRSLPKAINLPSNVHFSAEPLHFCCLTIGSRGDVQPYIALGKGLMSKGHTVTIVTHEEYKTWIEGFGIRHRSAGGDPGALMKLSVENKMFSPEFFRESLQNFKPWLDTLLLESWQQCQDADVLLESPSAMAGVHIAEALRIPYFRTFTMPWTSTSAFPHAFLSPPIESPTFNKTSYILFDNVLWAATSGQINRWRHKHLKIQSTDMSHLAQAKIPFIYNFSPAVVPKPLDWNDAITVSGYWFLDNPDPGWAPPKSLIDWMAKARRDGKAIVYIGFGSITVPHPNTLTRRLIAAVLKSDVRAIISKGWSARMSKETDPEPELPPECFALSSVPHDWLFPQVDAALHHGGAGTTGASLRAGIPTLIKPWFGDQYFWAARVQKLGAGIRISSLKVNELAEAIKTATSNTLMKEKAGRIGQRIRAESGVETAIQAIYTYIPKARKYRGTIKN